MLRIAVEDDIQKQLFAYILQIRWPLKFCNIDRKTTVLEKRLEHRYFPLNIARFLRTAPAMAISRHLVYQARNQEFFRLGEVSENKGTSTNI